MVRIGAPAYLRGMTALTKKRIWLVAWIATTMAFALQPLQWRDTHWMFYSSVAGAIAVAHVIRAIILWNKPDA